MADTSLLDYIPSLNVSNTDLLVLVREPNTAPSTNTVTIEVFVAQVANAFLITNSTPSNSSITVGQGMMYYDSNYLYIATANNVLKRVSLSSF